VIAIPAHSRAWTLRARQLLAVARMEVARGLSFWRLLALWFVAFAPVLVVAFHAARPEMCDLADETLIVAGLVELYYVRVGVFFGCLAVFMRLVGGEVAERTLHYLFLAPVRREVLVAGKFLGGALQTIVPFVTAVAATFAIMYGHFPAGRAYVLQGGGLEQLPRYLLVTTLACIGYGAVFLALSLLFKNPVIPAVAVFLWEGGNTLLPVWLKHLSVTFYLKPLFPVELPMEGILALFTVVAEPIAPWLAVSGLLAFSAAVVAFASWRMRSVEVAYTSD
jgi:ABC-type transport system involved in multi-copper enzyme maturation permease subunit